MQLTPAMKQYQEMKKQYTDCILFFRIGDFYEVFFEDAHVCHEVLDLVLTSKSKDEENKIPMAGIPYHSIDKYIPKLIQKGFKIAIAEQMTDSVPGKIVERQISQIITPGTYIQEENNQFNFIVAITQQETKTGEKYQIARGDFTIGEYFTKSFMTLGETQKRVLSLHPTEVILDINLVEKDQFSTVFKQYTQCLISVDEVPSDSQFFLCNVTQVQNLNSFGQAVTEGRLQAIALLLNYIKHTQHEKLHPIFKIGYHTKTGRVMLDDITIKNLELFHSSYEGNEKYSLFGILDTTRTNGGSRYLRTLLSNPTNTKEILQDRQQHILRYQELSYTEDLLDELAKSFDIAKTITTILYKKTMPFPFMKLRSSLAICCDPKAPQYAHFQEELHGLGLSTSDQNAISQLRELLSKSLKSDEEILGDTEFVQEGRNVEIDELRKIAYHSDELLLAYQQDLVQMTGVHNVKVKFIMNQGYFLEITNKDVDLFEEQIKKADQNNEKYKIFHGSTLKGGQRYKSKYLSDIESSILSSKEKLQAKEYQILKELTTQIEQLSPILFEVAQKMAELDVYASHALFAKAYHYVPPVVNEKNTIHIEGGRHPVIEKYLPKDQQFIPNTITLGNVFSSTGVLEENNGMIHIITGPNMGGKSTYLRQTALIVLLAHCGLFVPANKAQIGLVDGIFARVGSGDVIAKNQSTFMTEMIEVANILNNATSKSLIIFDELGRGTSTYDGIALTSAILQYILQKIQAKTLLATHYHELIALEQEYPQIKNFSVSVYETEKEVFFMKKIISGGANKSYGIDVAKIAGIPDPILQKSKKILQDLETQKKNLTGTQREIPQNKPLFTFEEYNEYEEKWKQLTDQITHIDINNLTPLQVVQMISQIQDKLSQS